MLPVIFLLCTMRNTSHIYQIKVCSWEGKVVYRKSPGSFISKPDHILHWYISTYWKLNRNVFSFFRRLFYKRRWNTFKVFLAGKHFSSKTQWSAFKGIFLSAHRWFLSQIPKVVNLCFEMKLDPLLHILSTYVRCFTCITVWGYVGITHCDLPPNP